MPRPTATTTTSVPRTTVKAGSDASMNPSSATTRMHARSTCAIRPPAAATSRISTAAMATCAASTNATRAPAATTSTSAMITTFVPRTCVMRKPGNANWSTHARTASTRKTPMTWCLAHWGRKKVTPLISAPSIPAIPLRTVTAAIRTSSARTTSPALTTSATRKPVAPTSGRTATTQTRAPSISAMRKPVTA